MTSLESAKALITQSRYKEAILALMQLLTTDSKNPIIWAGISICFYNLKNYQEAAKNAEMALQFGPNNPSALITYAVCLSYLGKNEQAAQYAQKAVQFAPDNDNIRLNWAYINTANTTDKKTILFSYREWGRRFADPITKKYQKITKYKTTNEGKLRLGFVSGDIRNHSMVFFVKPFFENYDKDRFSIKIYHTLAEDEVSQQIKILIDQWENVEAVNDKDFHQKIQNDEIDVLIDLSGHTTGARLSVFAMKPALLQITWLGFMNTLGMKGIDYRITDWAMDPPGNENFYVEKLLRLKCMALYSPPASFDIPKELPADKNGYVTLISMNSWRKLNDDLLKCWDKIIENNPTTRVIIISPEVHENGIIETPEIFKKYPHLIQSIKIVSRMGMDEFMQQAYYADLALDSFPISGGTTTLHSLWMGLPVVAIDSDTAVSSATAKTLVGLNLNECVAKDFSHYVEIVTRLINDKEELKRLRISVRDRLANSVLMQYQERTTELQDKIWSTWEYEAKKIQTKKKFKNII